MAKTAKKQAAKKGPKLRKVEKVTQPRVFPTALDGAAVVVTEAPAEPVAVKRKPGRPAKVKKAEPAKAEPAKKAAAPAKREPLTASQRGMLQKLGIPASLYHGFKAGEIAVPEPAPEPVKGPSPDELKGAALGELCKHLAAFEVAAKDNLDGNGEEYANRAAKVRWLIWKRQYTIA